MHAPGRALGPCSWNGSSLHGFMGRARRPANCKRMLAGLLFALFARNPAAPSALTSHLARKHAHIKYLRTHSIDYQGHCCVKGVWTRA